MPLLSMPEEALHTADLSGPVLRIYWIFSDDRSDCRAYNPNCLCERLGAKGTG